VIPDIPKHKFMKTVTFGSKSVGRAKDCMQIVDHEEIVFEETVEEECLNDRKPFNPESTGSLVLMDSVKQDNRDSMQQVMSSTAL